MGTRAEESCQALEMSMWPSLTKLLYCGVAAPPIPPPTSASLLSIPPLLLNFTMSDFRAVASEAGIPVYAALAALSLTLLVVFPLSVSLLVGLLISLPRLVVWAFWLLISAIYTGEFAVT